jgi:hypothetical protein
MATPMSSLLEEISREHFPYPPATPEEISSFSEFLEQVLRTRRGLYWLGE